MDNQELKSKTRKGLFWSFIDNAGVLGSQFLLGILLARILTPEDFGVIGMITVFINVGQFLMNSGFAQALVQKTDSTETDFSTVFFFNIFSSIVIWLLFYFTAPFIADFYHKPELVLVTRVITFSFVINSFGFIHLTHLTKKVEFKAQSFVGMAGVIISGVIAIILALKGFSYWSIVAQYLIKNLVSSVLLWIVSKWKPAFRFSWKSLKQLFRYSSHILTGGLITTIFNNIYFILIGRIFNATELGYYTRAYQFKDLPVNTINSFVQKVTYPVFSKIQNDDDSLISGLRKISRLLSAISLPLMVLMIIVAEPFISLVLTDKWLPSVVYLQMLSSFGWIFLLQAIYIQIATVKGRSDFYMQYQIIDKILIVLSILITWKFGIRALILGQLGATLISYGVSIVYLKKVITIKVKELLADIIPFLIASILLLAGLKILLIFIDGNLIQLILATAITSPLYIIILKLMRVKEADDVIAVLKHKLIRRGLKE